MLTEDENIVDVNLSVQYVIGDPKAYTTEILEPQVALTHATESALRHVVGGSLMDQVITEGRAEIAAEVQTRLQTYLDRYRSGLRVVKVNIDQSGPPTQVQDAFDDVQKAKEDEVRLRNEANAYAEKVVPEARGDAQKQIEEANAYRDQVIAEAQGEAERFKKLLAGVSARQERDSRPAVYRCHGVGVVELHQGDGRCGTTATTCSFYPLINSQRPPSQGNDSSRRQPMRMTA